MAKLEDHQSSLTTKLLLLGDSGSGKTGALASLAQAGFNLRIVDLDNGIDVLANLLRDPAGKYGKEALSRVEYETFTDPMKNVNGKLIPKAATVWQRTAKALDNWSPPGCSASLGPISSWTSQDVLVIDSLTMLGNAAINFVLSMNARLGGRIEQGDWFQAQQLVESLLQMLYDEGVKCNVIVIAHVAYIGEDNGPQKGYPATPGKALSPKVGRYFNNTLMVRSTGSGTNIARKILTNSVPMVELKTSAPTRMKPEYPLATGLAEIFKDLRGEAPVPAPAKIGGDAPSPSPKPGIPVISP